MQTLSVVLYKIQGYSFVRYKIGSRKIQERKMPVIKCKDYGFVRCNTGEMEQTKLYLVQGKVSEMACRRSNCCRSRWYCSRRNDDDHHQWLYIPCKDLGRLTHWGFVILLGHTVGLLWTSEEMIRGWNGYRRSVLSHVYRSPLCWWTKSLTHNKL
jgi:hypothetical protein